MTDLDQRITEMAREIMRDRGLEIDADEWFSTLEGLRQGVALGQESERERCAKVADERDALRSELAELRKPSVASLYGFQAGLGEADDVLDELERLRARVAGLERFVKHDELCSIIGGYGYCNCGLDALLEKDKS